MSRKNKEPHGKRRKKRSVLPLLIGVLSVLTAVLVLLIVLVAKKNEAPSVVETETESETKEEALLPPEPLVLPETEVNETLPTETETEAEKPVSLIFTGDILLEGTTLSAYQNSGLDGILSGDLAQHLQSADILMINEEFPFGTTGEKAPDKQYTFRTDPKYVTAFQDMGVDLVGLANNHVLDFGQSALLETFQALEGAGLRYAGAGADLSRAKEIQIFDIGGKRFGFLAASRVWPEASWAAGEGRPGVFGTYDPAMLLSQITSAKEEEACDFVTVFVHWGIERNQLPEDYQRSLAAQYAAAGADLVIGMHPHVLQGVEIIDQTPVFYSLGNFIFGGRAYDTAAVEAVIYPDGTSELRVIPCVAGGGRTVRAEGEDALRILGTINSISFGALLDENGILQKGS